MLGVSPAVDVSGRGGMGYSPASAASAREAPAEGVGEVDITEPMLLKALSWSTKFKNRSLEEADEVMAQTTHLKLHGQGITRVSDLTSFTGLQVLYLYDNRIAYMAPLVQCAKLTHLYLQNNALTTTDMIRGLPLLKKLYLDCNRLKCVSGFEGCVSLEELHISDQSLGRGECLRFDDACTATLSGSLKVLISQSNQIADAKPLANLAELEEVDLSNNDLDVDSNLTDFFVRCERLRKLSLLGNPICKTSRGIEAEAIVSCPNLQEYNNKGVSAQKRKCILLRHQQSKGKK